jgi:pyrimidine-nucleoside phosphorylase
MIPTRIIEAKRDGERIEADDLRAFLNSYATGDTPDYQMSAFLVAVYFNGLDADETDVFVQSMLASGTSLDLSYLGAPRVDKHSTGGVGDKVSLALAPLVASLGVFVPMMSGRGLGHTTGTLDKLEAIPGFRTDLSLSDFKNVLERVGCAMIGQTAEIAPLDKRLYALRDVTGTVAVRPLIAASIMSKKLAEGLTGLLLDVKVGAGAFIPEEDRAIELATTMVDIGSRRGLPTVALLTAMDRPLGCAIGNGLETAEAILCLRGGGPDDLRELLLRHGRLLGRHGSGRGILGRWACFRAIRRDGGGPGRRYECARRPRAPGHGSAPRHGCRT